MYKKIFFTIIILSMSFRSNSEIVFTDKFTSNTDWKLITDYFMCCCWNFSLHFCPLLIGNFPLAYGGSTFKEVKKWILKMVDENGMKIFKCGLCGTVFKDSSNIRRHMITLHMEASHNPCPNCSAVFSDKYKWRPEAGLDNLRAWSSWFELAKPQNASRVLKSCDFIYY